MCKKISIFLCIILAISLMSCNIANDKSTNKSAKESSLDEMNVSNTNVKINLGQAFYANIKGDLNEDGTYSDNGDYFLYKLKVENINNFEYIVINAKIQNDNSKNVKFFKNAWQATLQDGTQLSDIKIKEIGEYEELASGQILNITILIPIEKKLNVTEIKLKYDDKNYDSFNYSLIEGINNDVEEKSGIGCIEFDNIKLNR